MPFKDWVTAALREMFMLITSLLEWFLLAYLTAVCCDTSRLVCKGNYMKKSTFLTLLSLTYLVLNQTLLSLKEMELC